MRESVLLGRVVGVFGLAGAVKIEVFSDFPERFSKGRDLEVGGQTRTVESVSWHKGQARVKFEGVDTPDAANRLIGHEILAERAAPRLAADEYYTPDLIGMEVIDETGSVLGRVESVAPSPSADVLVVGEVLIPFAKAFVREVDMDRRRLTVALIPGMRPGEKAEEVR